MCQAGENGSNGLAGTESVTSKVLGDGTSSGSTSSPAVKAGGQAATEQDLQSRAAEEFQKGLSATTDDSSDEEDATTKTNKRKLIVQINAKPVGGRTVDPNLLRAATQQFKLGDGFASGRPSISRAAQDPFVGEGTLALPPPVTSQPGPVMTGLEGVSQGSGPIPEDFWKQTIPATAVAAAFQATGTILPQAQVSYPGTQGVPGSGMQQSPQGVGGGPPSYELPGGGVPPQQPLQGGVSASLSLPDGGVPPQALMPPPVGGRGRLQGTVGGSAQEMSVKGLVDLVGPPAKGPPPVSPSTAFVKRGQVWFLVENSVSQVFWVSRVFASCG